MKKTYLKLELEKAQAAYKSGNEETKKFLIDMYGEENFLTSIFDRLKDYESACKILGESPKQYQHFINLYGAKKAKRMWAIEQLATGIEAINEKWEADFENENQRKYYIYMYNKKRGCSVVVDYDVSYGSYVGSDLYIENEQKANHIAKIFKAQLQQYLIEK